MRAWFPKATTRKNNFRSYNNREKKKKKIDSQIKGPAEKNIFVANQAPFSSFHKTRCIGDEIGFSNQLSLWLFFRVVAFGDI